MRNREGETKVSDDKTSLEELNWPGLSVPWNTINLTPWPYYLSLSKSNCDHILTRKASAPAMSPGCRNTHSQIFSLSPSGWGEEALSFVSISSHITYKAWPKIKTSHHLRYDNIARFSVRKGSVYTDSLALKSHVYTVTWCDYFPSLASRLILSLQQRCLSNVNKIRIVIA